MILARYTAVADLPSHCNNNPKAMTPNGIATEIEKATELKNIRVLLPQGRKPRACRGCVISDSMLDGEGCPDQVSTQKMVISLCGV